MKAKILRILLLITLITSSFIPIIQAPSVEVSPTDSADDAFILGNGNYFGDTPFLFLRDEIDNLVIGNRFRNVAVPQGVLINNATLFVRSIYTYDSGVNLSVTITGDDIDDSEPFNDSSSFLRTYTTAYTVWNISEVNGDSWYNVTVTEIVQEIIDRIGWTSGNDLSLVIFTDQGFPRREYVSVDGNPAYTARLNITYAVPPSESEEDAVADQADPPYNDTDVWDWDLNDTYRGFGIWTVRTAVNYSDYDMDYATHPLNLTKFTEEDSGADIVVNSDYEAQITSMTGTVSGQLWNDTGAATVGSAVWRAFINMTDVDDTGAAGNVYPHTIFGASDLSGVSQNSHYQGTGLPPGDGIYMGVGVHPANDGRFRYLSISRQNGNRELIAGSFSPWYYEPQEHWIIFWWIRGANYVHYEIYNNSAMTIDYLVYLNGATYVAVFPGLLRYGQFSGSAYGAGIDGYVTYTLGTNIAGVDEDPLLFITYPNGTLVDPDPIPCASGNITKCAEDWIDDELGGAQPEDPEEDEYTVMDKFRWKLLVLAIGMIMMMGTPIAGVHYGASTGTWVKILFIMLCGLGVLWQIKFM